MPPQGFINFVSFIYLCYDNLHKTYSLETNIIPQGENPLRFTSRFMFGLEARHGSYDMGRFIGNIKEAEGMELVSTEAFAKWIRVNSEHLSHLPKTIWE
jgi:hypothetical protein